jgi:hypothetical protein
MDPRAKRIAAAQRNPNCVLLTWKDAMVAAHEGLDDSPALVVTREALEKAEAKIATLTATLGSVRSRLAFAERQLGPNAVKSPNGVRKAACSGCGKPCTYRPDKEPICRSCYRAEVQG